MNVFARELKSHTKSLVIWSVVITIFMFMSFVKYGVLATDAAASQELLKALPATLQAVFGMTGLNIATIEGYYGVCFIFIAVMLAIHAGMLGAELVAKEESGKTAEFLYVKPISRTKVLTLKLLAGLVLMATVSIVAYLATFVSIAAYNHGVVPVALLNVFSEALLLIQLVFFGVGVFSGAALGLPKKAAAITAAVVFTCYIAYVLWGLSGSFSWMQYISPFAYFAAKDIIASNTLNTSWALLSASIFTSAIVASYLRYIRRDFKV